MGKRDDGEKSPSCATFLKKEKVVCAYNLSLGGQANEGKKEEEANIQRHRLTVRDIDMFRRTWQKHWIKSC